MRSDMYFEREVRLAKSGYDPFLDFIKGYCILCVILAHSLPETWRYNSLFALWGGIQVPLFLLLQVFHAYKKGVYPYINIEKLIRRIVLPFVIVEGVLSCYYFFFTTEDEDSLMIVCKQLLAVGGLGPGSYYFWVYLQIAFLLPLFWSGFQKLSMHQMLIVFIVLCLGVDIILSIVRIPEWLYRLLAIRYLFLIFLGAYIAKNGSVIINGKVLFMSLASLFVTVFFAYSNYDLEPFFYNTDWKTHRWICYYYISSLFIYLLWLLYERLLTIQWLHSFILEIGRCSYEIFLFQLIVFYFIKKDVFVTNSPYLDDFLYLIVTILLSVFGGMLYNRAYSRVIGLQK